MCDAEPILQAKSRGVLAMLAALVMLVSSTAQAQSDRKTAISKGENAAKEPVSAQTETFDHTLILKGETQIRQGRLAEAEKTFLRADRKKLKAYDLQKRARFLIILKNYREALTDINRCEAIDKANRATYTDLRGRIFACLNDRKSALRLLKSLTINYPRYAEFQKIPTLIEEIGQYRDSRVKAAIRTYMLDPGFAKIQKMNRLAESALLDLKLDDAISLYSSAIELQPWSANTLCRRALAYHEGSLSKRALEDANSAIRLEKDNPEGYRTRIQILSQIDKDDAKVLSDWNSLLAIAQWSEFYLGRSKHLLKLGRTAEALRDIDEALRICPGKAEYLLAKGLVCISIKEPKPAIDSLTNALNTSRGRQDASFERTVLEARYKAYLLAGATKLAESDRRRLEAESKFYFDYAPFKENTCIPHKKSNF